MLISVLLAAGLSLLFFWGRMNDKQWASYIAVGLAVAVVLLAVFGWVDIMETGRNQGISDSRLQKALIKTVIFSFVGYVLGGYSAYKFAKKKWGN